MEAALAEVTVKKAIDIKAVFHVEGEDAPADDFAALVSNALRDIIASGAGKYPNLKITVKKLGEQGSGFRDPQPAASTPETPTS
jgi:hypothetical protein